MRCAIWLRAIGLLRGKTVKLGSLVRGARFELAIPQLRDYEISLPAMPVIR